MSETETGQVRIRAARPEDRPAVLAFCVDTFSWGDYIGEVWDRWLNDPTGRLMVAEVDGLPVGLQHLAFPSASEAWLQGMRIDPAVRRQGVATSLLREGMALASARGAKIVRLMTKVDNAPVLHMMEKAGFRSLNAYTDLRAPADGQAGPAPETAVAAETDDLWRLVETSETFHAGERTYIWSWQAAELTRERLARHVEDGEVLVVRQDGHPSAMALVEWDPEDASLLAGALYGEPEAEVRLALALRVHAARLAAEETMLYVPSLPERPAALARAGYSTRGKDHVPEMVLFVKELSTP